MSTKGRQEVVADACGFIHLLVVADHSAELFQSMALRLRVSRQVRSEIRFIREPPRVGSLQGRKTVELGPWEAAGVLETEEVGLNWADLLVECTAAGLSEADASALALAQGRSLPLLSDDNKVRKKAGQLFPRLALLSTLHLVREATARLGWAQPPIRQVLEDLRDRAHFVTPKTDVHRAWYEQMLS